jgi:hypothetical protein
MERTVHRALSYADGKEAVIEEISLDDIDAVNERLAMKLKRDDATHTHEAAIFKMVSDGAHKFKCLYESSVHAGRWHRCLVDKERAPESGATLWKMDTLQKSNDTVSDLDPDPVESIDTMYNSSYVTYRATALLKAPALRIFKLNDDNQFERRQLWDDPDIAFHGMRHQVIHSPPPGDEYLRMRDFVTITDTVVDPPSLVEVMGYGVKPPMMGQRRFLAGHWRQRVPGRWTVLSVSLSDELRRSTDGSDRYPPLDRYRAAKDVNGFCGVIIDDVNQACCNVTVIVHLNAKHFYYPTWVLPRYEQKLVERLARWERAAADPFYKEVACYHDGYPVVKGTADKYSF